MTETQEFFRTISENVRNWEVTPEAAYLMLVLAAFIVFIIFLGHVYNKSQRQSGQGATQLFTRQDPEDIYLFLQQAFEDRSKFEISFNPDMTRTSICALLDFDMQELVLELPASIGPEKSWKGRGIYVYFSIPLDVQQRLYFFFNSEILQLAPLDDSAYQMTISFPEYLEQKQRREFLRLDLCSEHIQQMYLWNFGQDHAGRLPKDKQSLGQPTLQYAKEQQGSDDHFSVVNISAGGIKLFIPKRTRKAIGFDPNTIQDVLLYLQLNDLESGEISDYYLLCRKRNYFQDSVSRDLEVGLQFIMQANIQRETAALHWSKVDPRQGVQELANWVFRQHLKMFREKGLP